MASTNEHQSPSNVTARRQPLKKRPRLSASSSRPSKTNPPNAYARRSPPRQQARPREPSPIADHNDDNDNDNEDSRSPPRKFKRPGAGARIAAANREAAETARRRREEEEERKAVRERAAKQIGATTELVASHYNAVPERGREWRRTDSLIKGLRGLNNWVKSSLIQKFSLLPEDENNIVPPGAGGGGGGAGRQQPLLVVLDMACGKGGDLGKWEKAPRVPGLYIGCDIADVSVEQARARWEESLRKSRGRNRGGARRDDNDGEEQGRMQMQAEFYVHDAFSRSLGDVPRIRQVGFNPHAGPPAGSGSGVGVIQGGMATGGFDVVSLMFALHYSYESEVLARGMLKNVAGGLKKGGRFFGVMPDSDVISGMVKRLLQAEGTGKTPEGRKGEEPREGEEEEEEEEGEIKEDSEDDWDPTKPSEPDANGTAAAGEDEEDEEWDPEKPSEPQTQPPTINGTTAHDANEDEDDDWDPEKPSDPPTTSQTPATEPLQQQQNSTSPTQTPNPTSNLPPLEWGNTLYTVRFPRNQPLTKRPLPPDGIFRPPYGWRYHYHLAEAVDVPEYVVPWEAFRALAEEYGLELLYRKGFREVLEDEGMGDTSGDAEGLGRLAERMGVLRGGRLLVGEEEMEAAGFYHAFCFYRT